MANLGIEGLDILLAKLEMLGGNTEEALQSGVDKAARRVKRDAKLLAPVAEINGGRLRNSIQHKIEKFQGNIVGIVYTNVEYAPYVEFGTGQRGESSQILKPEGISYRHDWRGQPPVPFLYPALIQNQENIKKDVTNEVKKAIREVCQK